jgi:Zn-finger in Ran binding protein and others
MSDNGLQNSIWAPQSRKLDSFRRVGDWICPSCGVSNFAWRRECFRCSPAPHANGSPANELLQTSVDIVTYIATSDHENDHLQPPESHLDTIRSPQQQPGLSTSRWAPRNFGGRPPKTNEVWTRVCSSFHCTPVPCTITDNLQIIPNAPIVSAPLQKSMPKPADLGLPYEVQHYILTMMQRIIEEGCFDFASRWIPRMLRDNKWDCPEAVELSTWRDILPTTLPPNSIVPHPSYSLERALADAVQIRNAAVHRHLCDNNEIRRMVKKAQDVMSMFSDATRGDKFHRLWIELNSWDQSTDPQGAKKTLLLALQEISERPVDDMDWSPNSVSLQEITGAGYQHRDDEEQYYGEAMDLD